MNKPTTPHRFRQDGTVSFWHLMLLVAVVVGFALFLNAKGTAFFTRTIPSSLGFGKNTSPAPEVSNATYHSERTSTRDMSFWTGETSRAAEPAGNYDDDLYEPATRRTPHYSYDEQYPPRVTDGYYTIQVFSGYNSKQAYDLRRSLSRDGYHDVHIHEAQTRQGVLFKVRVGRYSDRIAAFAIKDQVRRRYPTSLGKSFVVLITTNE